MMKADRTDRNKPHGKDQRGPAARQCPALQPPQGNRKQRHDHKQARNDRLLHEAAAVTPALMPGRFSPHRTAWHGGVFRVSVGREGESLPRANFGRINHDFFCRVNEGDRLAPVWTSHDQDADHPRPCRPRPYSALPAERRVGQSGPTHSDLTLKWKA